MLSTTRICILICVYLISGCLTSVNALSPNNASCVNLYEKGVVAYLDDDFENCISYLEQATGKYREYTKHLQNCRYQCQNEAKLSEPLYAIDVEDLLFFERTLKQTLCIVECKKQKKNIFGAFDIGIEAEKLFEDHKPYEYLHVCYFQKKRIQEAASAVFTYLVKHPQDIMMMNTLKYYATYESVNMNELVNYEAKNYVYLYIHGAAAYEKKDWKAVINNMEESLEEYLFAEEQCRYQCEGPFDHGWYPDFIPSIANHFTYCLRCKTNCSEQLNSLNGEVHNDLLPSHYHYLQYAYFKIGDLKNAAAAVASYLLFYPDDVTMLENMKYYSKLPKVTKSYFTPRSESTYYIQRRTYEKRITDFINKNFKIDDMSETKQIEGTADQ